MKMLVSSRFYMHERRFVVVYMECELEVQVYEPIQFDSIDCVLCRATSLGPLLSKAQNPNIRLSDIRILRDFYVIGNKVKPLKAIIRYSHISLLPIISYASLALHSARFTQYSILGIACKDCCDSAFAAESLTSVLQIIISLAESQASSHFICRITRFSTPYCR